MDYKQIYRQAPNRFMGSSMQTLSRFTGRFMADSQAGLQVDYRWITGRFTGRFANKFQANSKQIPSRFQIDSEACSKQVLQAGLQAGL